MPAWEAKLLVVKIVVVPSPILSCLPVLEGLADFLTGSIMESQKAARSEAVASPPLSIYDVAVCVNN